jgi:methionyl-tRNA formyltransferase
MKLALIGATDLTLAVAAACERAGHKPACVVTAERAFRIGYAPGGVVNSRHADVAAWAADAEVPCAVGADKLEVFLAEQAPDFALVAGWYHLLPSRVRRRVPRGCAGLHASLLPQLRGGAPLNWAILAGLDRTGVTLFELGDGVDDGPVYGQQAFDVPPRAEIGDLVARAEAAAVELIENCLPQIAAGTLAPVPQTGVPTYALQRTPDDGEIDWTRPAEEIDRLIRAVSRPYPGARTRLDDEEIRIWRATPLDRAPIVLGVPGQLCRLPDVPAPSVVTGNGILVIAAAETADGVDAVPMLARSANRRFDRLSSRAERT